MHITVNDEPRELTTNMSLSTFMTELNCSQPGTALAVNQSVVPRDRWSTWYLKEGDDLVIFQAIAGG